MEEEEDPSSEKQVISAAPSKRIKISNEFPSIYPDKIEFDGKLTINITIIGKKKCGKSALIKCYLKKSFESEKEDTTLDIFAKKILLLGHEVSLVISEVSQDKTDFQLSKKIIQISHIVFICFSLEDDIEKMNEDLIEGSIGLIQTIKKDVPIFIVGCKFDLIKEENIDTVKIINNKNLTHNGKNIKEYINNKREILKNNFCGYYITSSLLNLNIKELFDDAIKTVALPMVIKYQGEINDNDINSSGELLQTKIVSQKKNKGESNSGKYKHIVQVDDNGCNIF